jgi:anti-sigma factor RsiW
MTNDRPDTDSAWRQIEAAAAGDLEQDERQRFEQAMREDPALNAAFERARGLRLAIGRVRSGPVPRRLLWRLLAIPGIRIDYRGSRSTWRRFALPAVTAAATLIVALIALRPLSPERDSEEVAIQEFLIAMTYLQRSTAIAHSKVQGQVGSGFLEAMTASRDSLLGDTTNSIIENGG